MKNQILFAIGVAGLFAAQPVPESQAKVSVGVNV